MYIDIFFFIIHLECTVYMYICIIRLQSYEIDFAINVYTVNCLLIKFSFIRYGIIIVGNPKVLSKV